MPNFIKVIFILFFIFCFIGCEINNFRICDLQNEISCEWFGLKKDSLQVINLNLNIIIKKSNVSGDYSLKIVNGNMTNFSTNTNSIIGELLSEYLSIVSLDSFLFFVGYFISDIKKITGNLKFLKKFS